MYIDHPLNLYKDYDLAGKVFTRAASRCVVLQVLLFIVNCCNWRPMMNDRLRVLQRQPRRISITLSYHVHEALLSRSEEEGRSVSNLCAFLLEDALRDSNRGLNVSQPAQTPIGNLGHSQRNVHGNGHNVTAPIMRQPPQL
jgi:hypothetical protein